jgi:hypothetical protein
VALVALSGTQWHSWHSVALGGTRWHTAALRVPPGGLPSFPTDVTLERVLGILACTAHAVTSPRRLHTRGPRIALGRLTHLGCMQFLEVLGIIAQVIFHVRRRRFRVKARLQEGESHQVTSSRAKGVESCHVKSSEGKTRQDKARQDKARQDKKSVCVRVRVRVRV